MENMSANVPAPVKMSRDPKQSPWWIDEIEGVLRPESRKMLEEYAQIPPEQVVDHVKQARKRAYEIAPYVSIGALTWLNPYILLHEAHDTILDMVKSGALILDCGCFISTDMRQLAYEGAPTERMYGFDISPEFFDIAYDFYNDRDSFRGTFFQADALEDFKSSKLGDLEGQVDIIWCPKFLHLFHRPHQIELAARLVSLLKQQPGSLFVGSQNGYPESTELPIAEGNFKGQQKTLFMTNADGVKEMWKEVAAKTGTKWDVEARLLDLRTVGLHEDDGSEYKRRTGYNLQWTATLLEVAD